MLAAVPALIDARTGVSNRAGWLSFCEPSSVTTTTAGLDSPRPDGELLASVRQQVRILLASADRYDDGGADADDEAPTMAIRLRTLLHHTRASASAIVSSGHLDRMRFADSVGAAPDDGRPYLGMLMHEIAPRLTGGDPYVKFHAPLGAHLRRLDPGRQARMIFEAPGFVTWWTDVVVRDADGRTLNRKDIVLNVANKDGGGHLDLHLPADYLAISRSPRPSESGLKSTPIPTTAAIPCRLVRQVTWEFEATLVRSAPELLPDGRPSRPVPVSMRTANLMRGARA